MRPEADKISDINIQLAEIEKLQEDVKRESADLAILQEKYKHYRRRMRVDNSLSLSVMLVVFAATFLTRVPLALFLCIMAGGVAALILIKMHKLRHQKAIENTVGILETQSAALRQRVRDATSA